MFRITRGISLDHSPAFPNPSLRFPTGAPISIHDDESDAAPSPSRPAEASIDADQPEPGTPGESPSAAPS
ncbi:MAG TPA: hypothetical protein VLK84_32720 [Longimicrobium sp.]|nr:hypothetical protein [Longimicrobium sp.]